MNLDFPTILVILTFATGLIWGIGVLIGRRDNVLVEYSRSFFPVILIVLVLRSFIAEPFRIPSGSMMPTLLVGDFILVNKFAYGIRLPVINKKIIDLGSPKRGDVVVFRYPEDPSTDYIKRVVGLPGDVIAYRNKTLYVNGKPMPQEPVGVYEGVGSGVVMSGAAERIEDLDGVRHRILVRQVPDFNPGCVVLAGRSFRVPEGHYFAMGDNRDNSNDSRCWGTVPDENLVGRAFLVWMNWDPSSGPAWSRIGNRVE